MINVAATERIHSYNTNGHATESLVESGKKLLMLATANSIPDYNTNDHAAD